MINQFNIVKSEKYPIIEPVTLAGVKQYIGVDYDDFDGLLTELISDERETVEEHCALALVQSTVSFQVETTECKETVILPYAAKVENLVIKDEEDTAIEDYRIWGNTLRITEPGAYTVSYDIVPIVPKALKQCIQMLITYRFNNRGDQDKQQGIPLDIQNKLARYQIIWL